MSAKTTRPKIKSKQNKAVRSTYTFDLIYKGPADSYDDIEYAIIKAGREDIFFGWQNGAYHLGFSREALSFQTALLSAITDVECLGLGLELVDLEPDYSGIQS